MKNKWYEAKTGNHQGLIIEQETGKNIAVTYDKNDTPFIVNACNEYEENQQQLKQMEAVNIYVEELKRNNDELKDKNMGKIHFEIGQDLGNETRSVFTSDSLIECVEEYRNKKYSTPEYFIDIWEADNPIANIEINEHILNLK